MPVEIKELVIRMVAGDAGENPATPSAPNGNEHPDGADQDALVQACVRQVLAILEKKKKR